MNLNISVLSHLKKKTQDNEGKRHLHNHKKHGIWKKQKVREKGGEY